MNRFRHLVPLDQVSELIGQGWVPLGPVRDYAFVIGVDMWLPLDDERADMTRKYNQIGERDA